MSAVAKANVVLMEEGTHEGTVEGQVREGQVFNVTRGEWSDYHIVTTLRALKDFDPVLTFKAFVKQTFDQYLEQADENSEITNTEFASVVMDHPDGFVAYLVKEHLVEEIADAKTMHMGTWGDLFVEYAGQYHRAYIEDKNYPTDEDIAEDENHEMEKYGYGVSLYDWERNDD